MELLDRYMKDRLKYFYSFIRPYARMAMTNTPKGFYAVTFNERSLYNLFGVQNNFDLNKYLFEAEHSGNVYINVNVTRNDTTYDIYLTNKGMRYA